MDKNKIIILVVVILVLLIIVGGLAYYYLQPKPQQQEPTPTPIPTPEELTPLEKAEQTIADYDYNLATEQQIVEELKAQGEDIIPILSDLITSPDKKQRYISYIALSGLTLQLPDKRAELIELLKNGLNDQDSTIKVQAAQLITVWGEKQGIDALIDSLGVDDDMIPSEPQMTVRDYAYFILVAHTTEDFGTNQEQWQAWWDENKDDLTWNATTEKFE